MIAFETGFSNEFVVSCHTLRSGVGARCIINQLTRSISAVVKAAAAMVNKGVLGGIPRFGSSAAAAAVWT
jgi:hypothetical protein